MGKNYTTIDLILAQIKFAYIKSTIQIIEWSQIELVFAQNQVNALDLAPHHISSYYCGDVEERVVVVKNLHKQVQDKILTQNEKLVKIAHKHKRIVKSNEGDLEVVCERFFKNIS